MYDLKRIEKEKKHIENYFDLDVSDIKCSLSHRFYCDDYDIAISQLRLLEKMVKDLYLALHDEVSRHGKENCTEASLYVLNKVFELARL